MRKEYRQALRQLFPKALAEWFRQFAPTKEKSDHVWPGESLYLWQVRPDLRVYLVVTPDLKAQHDAFRVSLAWSRLNRFPHLSMRPPPEGPMSEHAEFARDEYEVALEELCVPRRDWWSVHPTPATPLEAFESTMHNALRPVTRDDARAAIAPLIDDALRQLAKVGIPYIHALEAYRRC